MGWKISRDVAPTLLCAFPQSPAETSTGGQWASPTRTAGAPRAAWLRAPWLWASRPVRIRWAPLRTCTVTPRAAGRNPDKLTFTLLGQPPCLVTNRLLAASLQWRCHKTVSRESLQLVISPPLDCLYDYLKSRCTLWRCPVVAWMWCFLWLTDKEL